MKTVIIYESMFGNTHHVAEEMAEVLCQGGPVELIAASHASSASIDGADLVIVGGPTHAHSMSWPSTRRSAIQAAEKSDELEVDPDAEGPGLRDWFLALTMVDGVAAAAFDTRLDSAPILTGRAARSISRRLHDHKFREIVEPESFVVDKRNHLISGEDRHAKRWAQSLLDAAASDS